MKGIIIIATGIALLSLNSLFAAVLQINPEDTAVKKVFYHPDDTVGWNAFAKGKIISLGVNELEFDKSLLGSVQDKTKVTVRLYNKDGIKIGDILYVINENGLIIAKFEVKSFFYTDAFGYLLIGYGSLRLAKEGNMVVQRVEDQYSQYAYIHKARGDFYKETGDTSESMHQYKKAIELDRGNPEAHLGLGYTYMKDDLLQFAYREFIEAYKNIAMLYDREDKYQLLKGLAEIRYREITSEFVKDDFKTKYLIEGIKYSKEALALCPQSAEVNYFLGMFYYKSPERSDADVKNYLLKAVEYNPDNVDAYLILAELYYNHKNMPKAEFYADMALKIDGTSERARRIKKLSSE